MKIADLLLVRLQSSLPHCSRSALVFDVRGINGVIYFVLILLFLLAFRIYYGDAKAGECSGWWWYKIMTAVQTRSWKRNARSKQIKLLEHATCHPCHTVLSDTVDVVFFSAFLSVFPVLVTQEWLLANFFFPGRRISSAQSLACLVFACTAQIMSVW